MSRANGSRYASPDSMRRAGEQLLDIARGHMAAGRSYEEARRLAYAERPDLLRLAQASPGGLSATTVQGKPPEPAFPI